MIINRESDLEKGEGLEFKLVSFEERPRPSALLDQNLRCFGAKVRQDEDGILWFRYGSRTQDVPVVRKLISAAGYRITDEFRGLSTEPAFEPSARRVRYTRS